MLWLSFVHICIPFIKHFLCFSINFLLLCFFIFCRMIWLNFHWETTNCSVDKNYHIYDLRSISKSELHSNWTSISDNGDEVIFLYCSLLEYWVRSHQYSLQSNCLIGLAVYVCDCYSRGSNPKKLKALLSVSDYSYI